MPFDLGDTVRLQATCTSPDGTPTTAATAVLTITLPDGTTTTPVVPDPAQPGLYTVDYAIAAAGRHAVRWVFTGPASAYTDMFEVRPAVPGWIISLADAKTHIRITTPADDAQMRDWLGSITEGIEYLCGAVARRTVTETQHLPLHGAQLIALRTLPVLDLVSMTPVLDGGCTYDVDTLDLDGATGAVQRLDGGLLYGPVRPVYVAGRVATPPSLTTAGQLILQHLWRTKYGSSRALPGVGGGEDFDVTQPIPGFGYAIPNRAMQLMEPHRLPPGIA